MSSLAGSLCKSGQIFIRFTNIDKHSFILYFPHELLSFLKMNTKPGRIVIKTQRFDTTVVCLHLGVI
jgi:hypothetical protein